MSEDEKAKESQRMNGWMKLNRAASVLDESRHAVLIRCVAKELEGKVEAGMVLISTESIERVKAAKGAAA